MSLDQKDILESTGWLHLDRIASSFRDEIKETWLDWIRKDTSPGVAARLDFELNCAQMVYGCGHLWGHFCRPARSALSSCSASFSAFRQTRAQSSITTGSAIE